MAVAVGPFKFVGAAAGAGASSVGEGVENLTADESTLSGLRESNEELRRRLAEADEYKQEAERLEGLLDLKKSYDIDGVAARIVGKSVEAYNQKMCIRDRAMARSQDPNSAGSQFYFCLGAQPMLDSGYTVFGDTIEGLDVIGSLRVGDVIEHVEIENAAE